MAESRIPIVRRLADDTVTDGTARQTVDGDGDWTITDFRDLDGQPLDLPPGASFEIPLPLEGNAR